MIQLKTFELNIENKLSKLKLNEFTKIKYKSITERMLNLLKLLEEHKDVKISEFTNSNVYKFKNLLKHQDINGLFEGIFKLDNLDNFIGVIPIENQEEIIKNINILKDNPIISTMNLEVYILAAEDSFIASSNRTALDPVAFAKIELNNVEYLIPISQWL